MTPKPSSPPLLYPEAVKSKSLPSELCRTGDSGLKSWDSRPLTSPSPRPLDNHHDGLINPHPGARPPPPRPNRCPRPVNLHPLPRRARRRHLRVLCAIRRPHRHPVPALEPRCLQLHRARPRRVLLRRGHRVRRRPRGVCHALRGPPAGGHRCPQDHPGWHLRRRHHLRRVAVWAVLLEPRVLREHGGLLRRGMSVWAWGVR